MDNFVHLIPADRSQALSNNRFIFLFDIKNNSLSYHRASLPVAFMCVCTLEEEEGNRIFPAPHHQGAYRCLRRMGDDIQSTARKHLYSYIMNPTLQTL